MEEHIHMYHAIREKLCHKLHHAGCALDLKTKDLIGSEFRCVICTDITLFALCYT